MGDFFQLISFLLGVLLGQSTERTRKVHTFSPSTFQNFKKILFKKNFQKKKIFKKKISKKKNFVFENFNFLEY